MEPPDDRAALGEMEDVLRTLGLFHLLDNFVDHRISTDQVLSLTDDQFKELGVATIGDRIRLREKCRELHEKQPSAVVERANQFQRQRCRAGRNANKNLKQRTRRIQIGWKHKSGSGTYTQVHRNRGGGILALDISKASSMVELKNTVIERFFPMGKNLVQDLKKEDLHIYLASFTGVRVEEMLDDGVTSKTVEDFVKSTNTSPIRIYMHTQIKSGDGSPLREVVPSAVQTEEEPTHFVDADTPTVQFNQQSYNETAQTEASFRPDRAASHFDGEEAQGDNVGRPWRRLALRRASREQQPGPSTLQSDAPRHRVDSICHSTARRNHLPVEVIEVVDSEDEELQVALMESMEKHTETRTQTVDVKDLIRDFQSQINKSSRQDIIISRRNVVQSAFRALRRPFDTSCTLYVKFSGEMGMDHGGPRREFFRLSLRELSTSSLFVGPENSKIFVHDLNKLESREYFLAGQLCAMSVLHDGPGVEFLDTDLVKLMLGVPTTFEAFDLDQIPECKDMLSELANVETMQQRDEFLSKHGDYLVSQGFTNAYRLTTDQLEEVKHALIKQYMYYRIMAEINQFTSGMDSVCGLWSLMKDNTNLGVSLLTFRSVPLTKDAFMGLYEISWSEPGSNKRKQEEDSIYSWELFLQDIHDLVVDVTFEELLAFITGADVVPPCGFEKKITIEFYSNEPNEQRLPFVSTCMMTLSLPRGVESPDRLKAYLVRSLKESSGFGKI